MNITHHSIHDKIKIFELAGDKTDSYDYAIPQSMADELQGMGIENPCQWFVADCSGPMASARLRHVGEGFFQIIEHRSKANTETMLALIKEKSEGGDGIVLDIMNDCAGNQAYNELDAGFVDCDMLIGLITEAYARGRKSVLVNEKKHIMESQAGGGEATANFKIVLHQNERNEYVVHFWNTDTGGYSYGIYCGSDKQEAMDAYVAKCEFYKVQPF